MRHTVFALAALLVLTAASIARSADADEFAIEAPPQTVAAGSIGGSWFIITTSFFELFANHIENLQYTIVPGGAISNPIAVDQGMATLAMGYTSMLKAAQDGVHPFQSAMPDLRGIANINAAGVVHAFVLADSGIEAWEDLAAKSYPLKVDTGPRGTGGELAASRALTLVGAGYDALRDWGGSITHSSYREATDRMKDGHIEAFINDDIIGNPTFVDLALARDVVLLPMQQTMIDEMVATHGYVPAVIPANTYEGQTVDIPSTAQHFVFMGHKDTPDDLVYAMTKLIFENKDHLVATHQIFAALDVAVGPRHFPIPLHPGAARYYREVGVLD